jgi:hypothetical protein
MACGQRRCRRRGAVALRTLLLLAACAAASFAAASAQCAASASLPRNFSSLPPFPTRPGFHDETPPASACADSLNLSTCERPSRLQFFNSAFWDRPRLARAALATHTPDAWRPLLAKLRAGRPITVLGFGSSVVEGHSGCYLKDEATLHAAGVVRAPPNMARVLNVTRACRMPGYMSALMHAINATWPHAAHTYVNAGVSGASLGNFASHMCVDAFLPTEVDLLLFEQHGEAGDGATAIRRGAAQRVRNEGFALAACRAAATARLRAHRCGTPAAAYLPRCAAHAAPENAAASRPASARASLPLTRLPPSLCVLSQRNTQQRR